MNSRLVVACAVVAAAAFGGVGYLAGSGTFAGAPHLIAANAAETAPAM